MYTRIFDKAQYGIVTELYAWMVFLLIILTYGMETGFFRFSRNEKDYEKVYSTTLISLLVTSVLFVCAVNIFIDPVAKLLKYEDHHDYIRMFAAIVAIDSFTAIPFARLRKENRAALFSIIKILNVVITIITVVFLLIIAPGVYDRSDQWFKDIYDPGYGVGYVFIANLTGSAATLLIILPFTLKVKPLFVKSLWIRMVTYSVPLMIAGLGGAINETLDKILLRRIEGEGSGLEMVGEYGGGYKIAVLMSLFIQMFRFAAEPFFFERSKREGEKETYAVVMKFFVIAMFIIYLVINLYISGFQFFIGESFRGSIKVVPVVSMGYLLYGIYVNHSIWYKLNDLTRYGIYITFTGAVFTILVNIIFIPYYGYMACAWAHVASYGSMIILSFILAAKHYRIEYRMKELMPYFIIAIGIIIISKIINYRTIFMELLINSILLIMFIWFAQVRDNIIGVILKKEIKRK